MICITEVVRRKDLALMAELRYRDRLRRYCDNLTRIPVHFPREQKFEQLPTVRRMVTPSERKGKRIPTHPESIPPSPFANLQSFARAETQRNNCEVRISESANVWHRTRQRVPLSEKARGRMEIIHRRSQRQRRSCRNSRVQFRKQRRSLRGLLFKTGLPV
jgi:hypothetical protein